VPSTPATRDSIFGAEYRTLTLGVISVMSIVAFEAMGVITAMPTAARDLDGLELYAWGATAVTAAALFATAAAGGWADQKGPLPPLACGLGVFLLGTVVCGFAPDMLVLLGGRALQGLGFGAGFVAIYVVIGRAYPEHMRPRVFTGLSGAWVVPGIVGPLVSGWITEVFGWRWVFLAIGLLIVPVAAVLLPKLYSSHLEALPGSGEQPIPGRKRAALFAALGVIALQASGQLLDLSAIPLALAGALMLWFALPRLLPSGTIRARRGLPTVVLTRGIFAGGFFGAEWFIPLMLVRERGLSSVLAGGALAGAAVGWFIGSWLQGRPTMTMRRDRLVTMGGVFTAIGVALSAVVAFDVIPWQVIVVTWTIGAFGMGILYGSLAVLVLNLSPAGEQGVNSAALQISDSIGVILATGLGGVIFATAHVQAGGDSGVYFAIFSVMAVIVFVGALVSPRVAPSREGIPA
jgi:MFS family permease